MKTLYANQLSSHLSPLSRCYCLVGPEAFLIQDSSDRIRAAAKSQGFTDRQLFTLENPTGFAWGALRQALQSPSLFSDKQLVEWLILETLSDKQLSDIEALFPIPESIVLVIRTGHLSKANMQTKWFKALSQDALLVQHWPQQGRDWVQWVEAQASLHGLTLSKEAQGVLSEQIGHYALSQLFMRLKLMPPGVVSLESVENFLEQQKEHDVFDLQNALLLQKPSALMPLLAHFKSMKTETSLVLWCITRLVQALFASHHASEGNSAPFWLLPRDHKLFWALKNKTSLTQLEKTLQALSTTDRLSKTGHVEESWQQICSICFDLTGAAQKFGV